ncbi:MAG: hypothetical protein ABUS54_00375 [Actinomycetota bacterium]
MLEEPPRRAHVTNHATPLRESTDFGRYETGAGGNRERMNEERQSDLIMASALAKTLSDVVERLDSDICAPETVDGLGEIAKRAEAELRDNG